MNERPASSEVTPFPFDLPPAFAEQLRYRWDRRFVGVHSDGDQLAITDGVHSLVGADYYTLETLLYQDGVLP